MQNYVLMRKHLSSHAWNVEYICTVLETFGKSLTALNCNWWCNRFQGGLCGRCKKHRFQY